MTHQIPVEKILEALKNGNAIITHDPSLIEELDIQTPDGQTTMFIDLAGNGETIVAEYTPIRWLYGTIGTGGACYHQHLTQHTQQIKVKNWPQYIFGALLASCSCCSLIAEVFAAPETGGQSLILVPGTLYTMIGGLNMMEDSIEVEYT